MEKDEQYTSNEWAENFANLMEKYDYKRGKSTTKIQKIIESKKEKKLKELFKDIQSFFKISIKIMPENVYLFIFEVIKELSNNENKTNSEYLEKIVEFLFNVPNFYKNFSEILQKYVGEKECSLFLDKIENVKNNLIEKWNNNFTIFKDKYFKKNKQKTKLQEIAKSGKEKELKKLLEDVQNLFIIPIELTQEQKICSSIFIILKEFYNNKIETNAKFLKKIFEFLNKIPNFNKNLEEYLKQNGGDVELFKQIEFFANKWDEYFVDLKKQYNYVGYDFKQEQEKPKKKDKQLRQKEENLEEEPQIENNYNSLIRDIQNIFSHISTDFTPEEVYLFISRVILDLSKTNEVYFKKVITLLDDIPYFNKCFKSVLNDHKKHEELNAFITEVKEIKVKALKMKLERSKSASNENTPFNQSLEKQNNLITGLHNSIKQKDQKIQKLEKEKEKLQQELLSQPSSATQTKSKRQVEQRSSSNRQGRMRQRSLPNESNHSEIGIHINGIQSPRIRNENQSPRQYDQYFSFRKDEKKIEETKEEMEEREQQSNHGTGIINKNQRLNEESGNLEGANNGFEVIADNAKQLNKSPELV